MKKWHVLVCVFFSVLLSKHAHAYVCIWEEYNPNPDCAWISGSSQTYHIDGNDFTTWQKDAIEDGASAWNAGTSGDVLQGANWHFNRGSDISNSYLGDGLLGVAMRDNTWFTDQGSANAAGKTIYSWFLGHRAEVDVYINSSLIYVSALPSASNPNTEFSLPQVAMHEFGHVIGFNHDDSDGTDVSALDTMDGLYPGGGDSGNKLRILENDFYGLATIKGDSSTGINLSLSKFAYFSSGEAIEAWTDAWEGYQGRDWSAPPEYCIAGADRPSPLSIMQTGSQVGATVEVAWYLSPNSTCFDSDDILMELKTLTNQSVLAPTIAQSLWCIPRTAISKVYHKVCAEVDPDNDWAETSETDNRVTSDKLFMVE